MQILEADTDADAFAMVKDGRADAFAMDDVLLYGLASGQPHPADFKVIGRFLTIEPLAIMLSKNDLDFKAVIDREMKQLIRSGEVERLYHKWFMQAIPPRNVALNIPPNYLLRDFWKYPTDFVPF
jgi:glutamate/aspartate transport system substrate-binding protein